MHYDCQQRVVPKLVAWHCISKTSHSSSMQHWATPCSREEKFISFSSTPRMLHGLHSQLRKPMNLHVQERLAYLNLLGIIAVQQLGRRALNSQDPACMEVPACVWADIKTWDQTPAKHRTVGMWCQASGEHRGLSQLSKGRDSPLSQQKPTPQHLPRLLWLESIKSERLLVHMKHALNAF